MKPSLLISFAQPSFSSMHRLKKRPRNMMKKKTKNLMYTRITKTELMRKMTKKTITRDLRLYPEMLTLI